MDTEPQSATDVAEDDEYAIVFPGQGSQSVGMAGKVLQVYPGAEHWFERANQILDYDLLDLIERGPAAETRRHAALTAGDLRRQRRVAGSAAREVERGRAGAHTDRGVGPQHGPDHRDALGARARLR